MINVHITICFIEQTCFQAFILLLFICVCVFVNHRTWLMCLWLFSLISSLSVLTQMLFWKHCMFKICRWHFLCMCHLFAHTTYLLLTCFEIYILTVSITQSQAGSALAGIPLCLLWISGSVFMSTCICIILTQRLIITWQIADNFSTEAEKLFCILLSYACCCIFREHLGICSIAFEILFSSHVKSCFCVHTQFRYNTRTIKIL